MIIILTATFLRYHGFTMMLLASDGCKGSSIYGKSTVHAIVATNYYLQVLIKLMGNSPTAWPAFVQPSLTRSTVLAPKMVSEAIS